MDNLFVPENLQREWKTRLRVRLREDLSRVHFSLVPGAEGIVLEFFGRQGDHIWQVDFLAAGTQNVAWQALEFIDAEFSAELDRAENERIHQILKEAIEAVIYVGKNGAYQALHVWNKAGKSEAARNREEAGKLVRLLKQKKVPVSQEVWR